jgi:hypothetical protein
MAPCTSVRRPCSERVRPPPRLRTRHSSSAGTVHVSPPTRYGATRVCPPARHHARQPTAPALRSSVRRPCTARVRSTTPAPRASAGPAPSASPAPHASVRVRWPETTSGSPPPLPRWCHPAGPVPALPARVSPQHRLHARNDESAGPSPCSGVHVTESVRQPGTTRVSLTLLLHARHCQPAGMQRAARVGPPVRRPCSARIPARDSRAVQVWHQAAARHGQPAGPPPRASKSVRVRRSGPAYVTGSPGRGRPGTARVIPQGSP